MSRIDMLLILNQIRKAEYFTRMDDVWLPKQRFYEELDDQSTRRKTLNSNQFYST